MDKSLINRVLNGLEERRKKVINGGINSIPSPFIRFSASRTFRGGGTF